ncbi:FAD-dependent oxidoreductase [Sphingobium sp. CFD-2]|uniref:FAD-dependent oxidoreductase n=1 Tax=Sphingobium sp. CFD-2 TaxID=2878542 RepID=UPI00214BB653|nr:FAD-dependent oxidoreductase [Sphingobium sp. CFD-2]
MTGNPTTVDAGSSRRQFFSTAAGAAAGGALGLAVGSTLSWPSRAAIDWAHETDILIVGSGAAALSAAVAAVNEGASVIIVEKGPSFGGTSTKSEGGMWVPNNRFLRARGKVDDRDDALRYMARCACPNLYRSGTPFFGMPEPEYRLMEAFYDNAAKAFEFLEGIGALKTTQILQLPDYYEGPENKVPVGRQIMTQKPDGTYGLGVELIRQLKAWLDERKVTFFLKHRAKTILRNEAGEVVGLDVTAPEEKSLRIRARKAVIFATGGFAHNKDMMRNFQPAPIYGTCSVPTSEGDFVKMAQEVDAKLGNLNNAWRMQVVMEHTLDLPSVPRGIWQPPGDSMVIVNKYGERVVNEKHNYHDRAKVHFSWDANREEYSNQFLFMIYDRRVAELFADNFPLPASGAKAAYVIEGDSLAALSAAIQARLKQHADRWGEFCLDSRFPTTIAETVATFNGFAEAGTDAQFQRGAFQWDRDWLSYTSIPREGTSWKTGETPSATMHPFQSQGPYYAIILGSGVLDTNGGPVINPRAQILDTSDHPIPGLYGAGNCISSPAGQSYWGGGCTLGLAMTYGHLAGMNAAREPVKDDAGVTLSVAA